jgi:hypothetical protein
MPTIAEKAPVPRHVLGGENNPISLGDSQVLGKYWYFYFYGSQASRVRPARRLRFQRRLFIGTLDHTVIRNPCLHRISADLAPVERFRGVPVANAQSHMG